MCRLKCVLDVDLDESEEETKYLTEIRFEIADWDEKRGDVMVGKGDCYAVRLTDARAAGHHVDIVLDIEAATDAYQGLFTRQERFDPKVETLVGAPLLGIDLLIIDRLEILPAFRGRGLSLAVFRDLVRWFGSSADLVALKAYPLQHELRRPREPLSKWEKAMRLKACGKNLAEDRRKLMAYYSRLGFRQFGDEGIMVALPWQIGARSGQLPNRNVRSRTEGPVGKRKSKG